MQIILCRLAVPISLLFLLEVFGRQDILNICSVGKKRKGLIMNGKLQILICLVQGQVFCQARCGSTRVGLGLTIMTVAVMLLVASVSCPGSPKKDQTIIDEWASVEVPPAPKLHSVVVDPNTTALLILDIQKGNCNAERRPRCVACLGKVKALLAKARAGGIPVIYSLTRGATVADIRNEVAPVAGEPSIKSGVDKFFGTDLEKMLKENGVTSVIIVGTSAHGAVLHTATGSALRGFDVIVPVDGMSAGQPYAEQYTAWHLVNAPGTRRQTKLTKTSMIRLK